MLYAYEGHIKILNIQYLSSLITLNYLNEMVFIDKNISLNYIFLFGLLIIGISLHM